MKLLNREKASLTPLVIFALAGLPLSLWGDTASDRYREDPAPSPPLYTVPPIIIEEKNDPAKPPVPMDQTKIPTTSRPHSIPHPLQLQAGPGSAPLYGPTNQLGIELTTMERASDISQWRRNWSWIQEQVIQSAPRTPDSPWTQALRLNLLKQRGLGAKILGRKGKTDWHLQAGGQIHQQKVSYWDNHQTPYTSSDDTLKTYIPYQRDFYLSLQGRRERHQFIVERDQHKKDVLLSKRVQGQSRKGQWEGDYQWDRGNQTLVMYSFLRQEQFNSQTTLRPSTDSRDLQTGLSFTQKWPGGLSLNGQFQLETLKRESQWDAHRRFQRRQGEIRGEWQGSLSWIEWSTYLFHTQVQDRADWARGNKSTLAWNGGASITTAPQINLGLSLKGQFYQRIPTPSSVFGDGGLLQGSPDLPLEKGRRAQIGPWLDNQAQPGHLRMKAQASFFLEETQNLPLQMKTSPASVRTFAVGGIWTRGLEVQGEIQGASLSLEGNYIFQRALNATQIPSQRGKRIPGRPQHSLTLSSVWRPTSHWQLGPRYTYTSSEDLDLSNTWKGPEKRVWDFFVQYQKNPWAVRLEANHLFPPSSRTHPGDSYQGRVAPNLLEREMENREFLLTIEVII